MNKQSEPTTGEIVRALRELVYEAERKHETQLLCTNELILAWANDLERKESDIAVLTARAEQAERERDAVKLEFATIEEDGLCSVCKFESSIPLLQCMEDCCFKHRGLSSLSVDGVSGDGNEWRGQPQDGEGK